MKHWRPGSGVCRLSDRENIGSILKLGFHRIDKLDNAQVDVIASWTLERSNVKAGGARGNAGRHGSCLARGARWPQDNHDASLSGGSTTLSVTGGCRGWGGDTTTMEPRPSWRWSILLTFEKLMYQRATRLAENYEGCGN